MVRKKEETIRVVTEKYILVQRYADNGQKDHLSLFNTQTGTFVLENIEEYEEAQQLDQLDTKEE